MTKKKIIAIIIIFLFGAGCGLCFNSCFMRLGKATADNLRLDDQEATVRAVNKIMPAVVSILVYNYEDSLSFNLESGKSNKINERKQVGAGTGFIISADGLILTNKHVITAGDENTAEYRIILNSGKKYYAQLIGKDPLNDLAILKIFDKNLPFVELGDSDKLQIGTTVIAIGNVLGEYQNSATKGIVSGLGRKLEASDEEGNSEPLDNAIQTDAEINLGNSGGPLVNLDGKVVGINSAVDLSGSAIGFAIPINDAKPAVKSYREQGRIIRPRMGVRYVMVTPEMAQKQKLNRESGALIIKSENESGAAVLPGSPAEKADLQEGDIIFEVNAIKVDGKNTLLSIIQKYKPGNKLGLKLQRGNKVLIKTVELDEFK